MDTSARSKIGKAKLSMLPSLLNLAGPCVVGLSLASEVKAVPVPPLSPAWLANQDGYLSEQEALASFFPTATEFRRGVALPAGLTKADLRSSDIPRHYFRHAAYKNGELLGFAVIDNVPGKARPITYMLATSAPDTIGQVRILGVEILVYRESHGFEVGRASFRKQFTGKTLADSIALKDDIRNVAGATISCRSVTDGIHDLLALIHATPIGEVVASSVTSSANRSEHSHKNATHLTRTQLLMNAPLRISIGMPKGLEDKQATGLRERAIAVTEEAFELVAALESELSLFQKDSTISKLNALQTQEAVEVSDAAFEVLQRTQYWSSESGGALDPTAGALFRLWKEAPGTPSTAAIESARKVCGSEYLLLTPRNGEEPPTARLTLRGAKLDLGGSAKGFALDQLAGLLRKHGIEQACLDFGGQLLVLGAPHEVTLRDIPSGAALVLPDGSLATTGDDERGLILGGVRLSHIIDPRTGQPARGEHTVTVFANSALDADALSTLLFTLDFEAAKAFAESRGIAARFTQANDSDNPKIHRTSAWSTRFEN
jgi:FAD:protein FMN transferase